MYATKFSIKLFFVFSLCFFLSSSLLFAQDAKKDSATAQTAATPSGGGDVAEGKQLFVANCKQCHAITDEVVIGPGLKGIDQRRQLPWILKWVKNSKKVIDSGDEYAVALFKKYNGTQMTSFDNLTDGQIQSIVAYVKAGDGPAPTPGKTEVDLNNKPQDASGEYYNIILFGLVVVLLLVLAVLVLMSALLGKLLKDKSDLSEDDKEIVYQNFDFGKFIKSKALLSGLAVLTILVLGKVGLDKTMEIGVSQGYAPRQPIAFSHKLHAGEYEIACNYCHTGVYKGKSASIPSANICMNCHNAIKQGSPEIKKIYTAIEKDQPIEWIRVHNLPDLAYFNHSQHTNVAGLACENCHGEIKKMEVVQQYSPLTMGWCIDCHRKTSVNSKDNAYYDKLVELHNKTEKGEMKVVYIGGLECSKCHY